MSPIHHLHHEDGKPEKYGNEVEHKAHQGYCQRCLREGKRPSEGKANAHHDDLFDIMKRSTRSSITTTRKRACVCFFELLYELRANEEVSSGALSAKEKASLCDDFQGMLALYGLVVCPAISRHLDWLLDHMTDNQSSDPSVIKCCIIDRIIISSNNSSSRVI